MSRKKDTNGSPPPGWDAVAKASAANEAAEKKGKRPVQTSLLNGNDPIVTYEHHDVETPISIDEAELLNARSADETAKAMAIEEEVAKLKADLIKPKEAAAKEHRKNADEAAKEAREHKRTISTRLRVEYHPARATVSFFDPETGKKAMLDRAMTPREVERYANGDPPPDGAEEALEPPGGEA